MRLVPRPWKSRRGDATTRRERVGLRSFLGGSGGPSGEPASTAREASARPSRLAFAGLCLLALAALSALFGARGPTSATAQADPCPNAEFRVGPSKDLPNCRAYELVSPLDKNGGSILDARARVSPAGDAVTFSARQAFAGAPSAQPINNYIATRGSHGWTTSALLPAYANQGGTSFQQLAGASEDLSRVAVVSRDSDHANAPIPPDPSAPVDCRPLEDPLPEDATGCRNLYLRSTPSGLFDLLTPDRTTFAGQDGVPPANADADSFYSGTPDYGHVVYRSPGPQVPGTPDDGKQRLWEWDHGTIRQVSIDPNGSEFAGSTNAGHDQSGGSFNPWQSPPISDDGTRIYMTSGDEVYLREDGGAPDARTHHVSAPESSDPAPPGNIRYLASSRDGARAILSGTKSLLDEDDQGLGQDLYLYEHTADPETDDNLVLITEDEEPADGTDSGLVVGATVNNGAVGGLLGGSDDFSRIYFASGGQLVAGEPTDAELKLYLYENDGVSPPSVRFLAGLANNERNHRNWSTAADEIDRRWPVDQVTPDGRRMILTTPDPLRPDQDGDSDQDVYLYDAIDDELTCVSCQPVAAPSAGDSVFRGRISPAVGRIGFPSYNVSADGSRVFFDSPDALVPGDGNQRRDVYQWEDGELSLISTGQGAAESTFLGASADGDEVFFRTRDRLVDWDIDGNIDLYVASVGGGLPGPDRSAPCQADACQGDSSPPPEAPTPGSSGVAGPGNPSQARSCRGLANRASQAGRRAKNRRQRVRTLRQRARRQARRGNGQRAKRLRQRSNRVQRRARQARRRAQRLRERTRQCREQQNRKRAR